MRCSSRSHPPGCSGKGKKSRIISQYLRAIISEASPAPYEVSDKTPRCCQTESGTVLFEEITFRLSFLPVQVILDNLHGISSPNVEHDYFTKTPEDAVLQSKSSRKMKNLNPRKIIAACCLTLLVCGTGCQKPKQAAANYESLLTGRWKFSEISNGVTCTVTFHPDHRMTQYFEFQHGGGKARPGEWHVSGDTLFIREKTGESALLFETLNDSVLILLTHDSIPVVFERITEELVSQP